MSRVQRFISILSLSCCATSLAATGCGESSNLSSAQPSRTATSHETADAGKTPVLEDPKAVVSEHINVVLQRIAANNAQDWDRWQALHTEDAVRTAPGLPGPLLGAAALRAGIEALFTTFPDYHLELVDAFGQGDQLVARIHTHATMQGPLQLGEALVPATGKSFEQDWLALLRFENNKIASIDEFYDNYEILVQLGLSQ